MLQFCFQCYRFPSSRLCCSVLDLAKGTDGTLALITLHCTFTACNNKFGYPDQFWLDFLSQDAIQWLLFCFSFKDHCLIHIGFFFLIPKILTKVNFGGILYFVYNCFGKKPMLDFDRSEVTTWYIMRVIFVMAFKALSMFIEPFWVNCLNTNTSRQCTVPRNLQRAYCIIL